MLIVVEDANIKAGESVGRFTWLVRATVDQVSEVRGITSADVTVTIKALGLVVSASELGTLLN